MMAFTSPKATSNISRAIGGGFPLTGSPTIKISMRAIKLP
jgi:hypothetical protein